MTDRNRQDPAVPATKMLILPPFIFHAICENLCEKDRHFKDKYAQLMKWRPQKPMRLYDEPPLSAAERQVFDVVIAAVSAQVDKALSGVFKLDQENQSKSFKLFYKRIAGTPHSAVLGTGEKVAISRENAEKLEMLQVDLNYSRLKAGPMPVQGASDKAERTYFDVDDIVTSVLSNALDLSKDALQKAGYAELPIRTRFSTKARLPESSASGQSR